MKRADLPDILYEILRDLNGRAPMMIVFRYFWNKYGKTLSPEDDMFYTWTYDIRWAATQLRQKDRMKPASTKENTHGSTISPRGIWEIK